MSITKKSDVGNIKEDVGKEDPYLLLIQPLWFGEKKKQEKVQLPHGPFIPLLNKNTENSWPTIEITEHPCLLLFYL